MFKIANKRLLLYPKISWVVLVGSFSLSSAPLAQEARPPSKTKQPSETKILQKLQPTQEREKAAFVKELEQATQLKKEAAKKVTPKRKKDGLLFLKPTVGASFIYFEDSIADRIRQMTETVQIYHSDNQSFVYGNDQAKYEDRGSPNIYLETNWVNWRTSFNENLSTELFYGFKDYHNGGGDEHVYTTKLNHIFKDKLLTTLDFSHFDVTQNNEAILRNLEVNRSGALFEWLQTEKISFQWGYFHSAFSDNNDANNFYGGVNYIWLDFPIVETNYQYSYTTFDFDSPFYFSFDGFQNHLISFNWEHNVTKQFGYALRARYSNDNVGREAWTSQWIGEIFLVPLTDIFLFVQYAYYDSEVLDGKSYTSNLIYVTFSVRF